MIYRKMINLLNNTPDQPSKYKKNMGHTAPIAKSNLRLWC